LLPVPPNPTRRSLPRQAASFWWVAKAQTLRGADPWRSMHNQTGGSNGRGAGRMADALCGQLLMKGETSCPTANDAAGRRRRNSAPDHWTACADGTWRAHKGGSARRHSTGEFRGALCSVLRWLAGPCCILTKYGASAGVGSEPTGRVERPGRVTPAVGQAPISTPAKAGRVN